MSTKYGGYRPYSVRESLLTWAPQAPSRQHSETKFQTTFVPPIVDSTALRASAAGLSTLGVAKEHFVKGRDVSGVAMLPIEKPTSAKSTSSSSFVDFRGETTTLRRFVSEHLAGAADAAPLSASAAAPAPSRISSAWAAVDRAATGYILGREVRQALREIYGGPDDPSMWALKSVEAKVAPSLAVSWAMIGAKCLGAGR